MMLADILLFIALLAILYFDLKTASAALDARIDAALEIGGRGDLANTPNNIGAFNGSQPSASAVTIQSEGMTISHDSKIARPNGRPMGDWQEAKS